MRLFKLRNKLALWLGLNLCLSASAVVVQDPPAGAISLSAFLQKNSVVPGAQEVLQLNRAVAAKRQNESHRTTGSWSATVSAPAMFRRGTSYQSAQIAPVGAGVKLGSQTRRVAWEYSFLSSPPAGMHDYLCNYARCVGLGSASGSTNAFDGDNSWSYFSFVFVIDGSGVLTPALQGSRSQVLVNYD